MTLAEATEKVVRVIDVYADKFSIARDKDWFLLKLQEELGELTAAHLRLTQRARIGDRASVDLEKNLRDEVADVLAMTLLFAHERGIDVDEALREKWFKYL